MSYFDGILKHLKEKRQRALDGLYNCIPLPFPRFRNIFPGIQMGKYIIVTANQKVGKTKFCDFIFVYETIEFILNHPEVRAKILYFCLEESPRKKYIEFLCHLLWRLDRLVVTMSDIESTDKDHPIKEEILDILGTEKYQRYIKKFEETVEYLEEPRNPTGINKKCREYALNHGHLNYKKKVINDPVTGKPTERDVIDTINPYTPDDPEEYRIVILDNASNLTSENGLSKRETIEKLSKYAITLRDQLKYTFVLIQHQAQDKEGNESFKLDRIKPTSDGMADAKTTVRDCNMVIGLYSPFKFGKDFYEGYDIKKFRNHIRFMEVLEDRDYGANNQICPLYFDGASSYFSELPRPDDKAGIEKVYKFIEDNKNKKSSILMTMLGIIVNKFKK